MDNNSIAVEVPAVFYEAFLKAVEKLQSNRKEIEITNEHQAIRGGSFIFTVKAKEVIDFYNLGKAYVDQLQNL